MFKPEIDIVIKGQNLDVTQTLEGIEIKGDVMELDTTNQSQNIDITKDEVMIDFER